MIFFAVLRAVALSIAAITFWAAHAWMPIAAIVAMKRSLQQSALVAEQRLAGATLAVAVAALFLLTVCRAPS